MPTIVYTPDAAQPMPVFSQAVISRGYVYVSGNIGCLPDLSGLVSDDVQEQTVSRAILIDSRHPISLSIPACSTGEHVQGAPCSWIRTSTHRQSKHLSDKYAKRLRSNEPDIHPGPSPAHLVCIPTNHSLNSSSIKTLCLQEHA